MNSQSNRSGNSQSLGSKLSLSKSSWSKGSTWSSDWSDSSGAVQSAVEGELDAPSTSQSVMDERQVLIIMLLAQVCALYDPTPRTFVLNVLRFVERGILESMSFLERLGLIPPHLISALPLTTSPMSVTTLKSMLQADTVSFTHVESINVSRFHREFKDAKRIGKGAFGEVCRATHVLDSTQYAVKKIIFSNKGFNDPQVLKTLREVKCLAKCDHPNVTRYYGAWLEPTWLPATPEKNEAIKQSLGLVEQQKLLQDIHQMVDSSSGVRFRRSLSLNFGGTHELSEGSHSSSDSGSRNVISRSMSHQPSLNSYEENRSGEEEESSFQESTGSIDQSSFSSSGVLFVDESLPCREKLKEKSSLFTFQVSLYIQMALCEESTLQTWLNNRNASPKATVNHEANLQLLRQLTAGLAHVHESGIMHRDLKPANIFMSRDGVLKIGDFGLSKDIIVRDGLMRVSSCEEPTKGRNSAGGSAGGQGGMDHTADVGTVTYASPEQNSNKPYDQKADMYSVGVIMMELYHIFDTQMERISAISGLQDGKIPEEMERDFPDISKQVKLLTSLDSSKRPSANELASFFEIAKPQPVLCSADCIRNLEEQILQKDEQLRKQEDELAMLRDLVERLKAIIASQKM